MTTANSGSGAHVRPHVRNKHHHAKAPAPCHGGDNNIPSSGAATTTKKETTCTAAATATSATRDVDVDTLYESVQQRLEKLTVEGVYTASTNSSDTAKGNSGILKTEEERKYNNPQSQGGNTVADPGWDTRSLISELTSPATPRFSDALRSSCVKEMVVEKTPVVPVDAMEHMHINNSSAVEGYVPGTASMLDARVGAQERTRTAEEPKKPRATFAESSPLTSRSGQSTNTGAVETTAAAVPSPKSVSVADLLSRKQDFDEECVELKDVDVTFSYMTPEEYERLQNQEQNGVEDDDNMSCTSTTSSSSSSSVEGGEKNGGLSFAYHHDDNLINGEMDGDETLDLDPSLATRLSMGKNLFDDDDDSHEGEESADTKQSLHEASGQACALDMMDDDDNVFGGGAENQLEPALEAPAPRSFLKIWQAFAVWVTPDATVAVKHFQSYPLTRVVTNTQESEPILASTQFDTSDVGSSRCGGLMAMVRLHLGKSLDELNLDKAIFRKTVQERIALLLMRFDYSEAIVKLDTPTWRAMTTIFVSIVNGIKVSPSSPESAVLPKSMVTAGIAPDEYKYLSQSALLSFNLNR